MTLGWPASGCLGFSEPNVVVQSIETTQFAIRDFANASYLRLDYLGLADLCQLYSNEEEIT